ncbi:uncharacterized protein PFL1_04980 [Pseudozyma flocculosa PF-1]|uniref:Related to SIZ1 - E3-like factor in the SUMO pathway n=2 Tax=Pseudozyma flocculosa TaxID=84751 RepID=A0A5C3EYD6_9BASI|nr:uncharacterized protein PFL1_04980 [Pseudozyma flocculosa PF-1]EPQ27442.1 hypothetical protein PFL1_04980 [Pseudozyma flocculosa PF-1]SPO36129.1 related to SIZ1 - E3-like factor in the SUMO pathway [Pseudozyma flocculosa]
MAGAAQSSQAGATDPFADFSLVENAIRGFTIKALKAVITDINKSIALKERAYLRLSGNKAELANRVLNSLQDVKKSNSVQHFQKFKQIVVENGGWIPNTAQQNNPIRPSNAYAGASGAAYQKVNGASPYSGFPPAAGSASPAATTAAARTAAGNSAQTRVNFKPSPFWEIKSFVSNLVICPEAPSTERKTSAVYVTFTEEYIARLRQANSAFQARLFCTTHEAYAVGLSGRFQAPVEFPLTCEVRVNGTQLSTNLRGSKKNVGRVPPPNLNKDNQLLLQSQRQNRIELTYTNCPKRHVLIVAVCEVTSAEMLVERLRKKAHRTKEDVLRSMKKAAEDDDIQTGSATMSLKCPLSYTRMTTPSRSTHCPHVACFDAYSFYSINEQTPSWSCPHCNQTIRPDDLIVDDYVGDIIKKVPDDYETVIVEPDGSWRTPDGKVASEGYVAAAATGSAAPTPGPSRPTASAEPRSDNGHSRESRAAPSSDDIVILDSPSPPPVGPSLAKLASATPAPPPPLPSLHPPAPTSVDSSRQSSARPAPEPAVIDLTLSDSDDEPLRLLPRPRPPLASSTAASAPMSASASASSSSAMRPPHLNGSAASQNGAYPRRPSSSHAPPGQPQPAAGGSLAAAARRPSTDGARSASSSTRHANDDTPSDDEVVRRPGKKARLEASQGAQPGPGPGRPLGNGGLPAGDSPRPGSDGSAGGPFAGPSRSNTNPLHPSSTAVGSRYAYPPGAPRRLSDRGGVAGGGAGTSSSSSSRPSYPVPYLDTDIGVTGNGNGTGDGYSSNGISNGNGARAGGGGGGGGGGGDGSSPLGDSPGANGRRTRRGEGYDGAEWGDDVDGSSERGYTGVGRDTYFADDDWW